MYYFLESILLICICTTIVFSVCWIDIGNMYLNIVAMNLPYVIMLFVDIAILASKKMDLIRAIWKDVKVQRIFSLILIIYVLYELFNIANGWKFHNYTFLINRILIIAKFSFLLVNVLIYMSDLVRGDLCIKKKRVLCAIGLSSYFVVGFTLIKYFTGNFIWLTKITPYHDYNAFSNVLIFSTIVMLSWIIIYIKGIWQLLMLFTTISINFTVVLCTGSRRGVIFIMIASVLLIIAFIIHDKINRTTILHAAILCVACISIISVAYYGFNKYVEFYPKWQIEKAEEEANKMDTTFNLDDIDIAGKYETNLSARYETINIEEGLASRWRIWEIAINEIKKMSTMEKIIGNGASYGQEIYKKDENRELLGIEEKAAIYSPHNILLNDILEGGVLKLLPLVAMVIIILRAAVKIFRLNRVESIMIIIMGILLAGDSILGADRGMLGKDWFWFLIIITYMTYVELKYVQNNMNIDKKKV